VRSAGSADRDHVDRRIGEHGIQVMIGLAAGDLGQLGIRIDKPLILRPVGLGTESSGGRNIWRVRTEAEYQEARAACLRFPHALVSEYIRRPLLWSPPAEGTSDSAASSESIAGRKFHVRFYLLIRAKHPGAASPAGGASLFPRGKILLAKLPYTTPTTATPTFTTRTGGARTTSSSFRKRSRVAPWRRPTSSAKSATLWSRVFTRWSPTPSGRRPRPRADSKCWAST